MRVAAALLVLGLLLSGCAGKASDDDRTDPALGGGNDAPETDVGGLANATTPGDPLVVESNLCEQAHAVFPFPEAAFGPAPAGFTYSSFGAGTILVAVYFSYCQEGNVTADGITTPVDGQMNLFWAGLALDPPAEHADDEVLLDVLPLFMSAGTPELTLPFTQAGISVEVGDTVREGSGQLPGAAHIRQYLADSSSGTFRLELAVTESLGSWAPTATRIWAFDEAGAVAGAVRVADHGGASIGEGSATLAFTGDPLVGPPPAWQGLAHLVTEMRLTYTVDDLGLGVNAM